MSKKEQQEKSQRISGLEVLMGTDAYRKNIQDDLEEDARQINKVLEASSVLLEYQSDRLANGERVWNTLSEAVSELLSQQTRCVESLVKRAKRLAELSATIPIKAAEVQVDPRLTRAGHAAK